jgi:hypothetical protein
MNRSKTIAIAAGLILVMATAASAAYTVLLFDGHTDYTVSTTQDTPCGYVGIKGQAQPVTFDKTLWLVFTCQDESVVARRLHVSPIVYETVTVPPLVPTYQGLPNPPQSNPCEAKYPGFVEAVGGGCVPPDHPAAKKPN